MAALASEDTPRGQENGTGENVTGVCVAGFMEPGNGKHGDKGVSTIAPDGYDLAEVGKNLLVRAVSQDEKDSAPPKNVSARPAGTARKALPQAETPERKWYSMTISMLSPGVRLDIHELDSKTHTMKVRYVIEGRITGGLYGRDGVRRCDFYWFFKDF